MRVTSFFILSVCFLSVAYAQTPSKLEVVVAAPQGETPTIDQTQTIFVSFSEPMVPLKEVPPDESTGPMEIQPKIKGKYRWMGTRTIAFIPAGPLPYATQFVVRVPAGTSSLAGKKLEKEYRWVFETPRPRVVTFSPYNTQRFVELDHKITIQFNQKIDPDKVGPFLSIEENVAGARSYPPFSVRLPKPDEIKLKYVQANAESIAVRSLFISLNDPMRKGATYTVRAKAGLPGTEGPLGMISDHVFSFSTFNELSFVRVKNEDRFNPAHSLVLIFSNPVSIKDVARLLVFEPAVKFDVDLIEYDYQIEEVPLRLPLDPERSYNVTLKPGLKDRFGNEITRETMFSFRTGSFKPFVRMTTGPGVIEAYESHKYPVTFMNIDSVRLQMGNLPAGRIVPVMRRLDFSYYSQLAEEEAILEDVDTHREGADEFSRSRIWRIGGPRNKQSVRPLDLDELLGKSTLGVALVQVDNLLPGGDRRYYKALLQVTHLGITAKFSPTSSLVWVTTLKDASPVAGASVEIRNDSNRVVWAGKADAKGLAKAPGWGILGLTGANEWEQPRQWVIVRKGDDMAFSSSDWQNGIEPWQFGLYQEWNPQVEPMQSSIFTDRGLYKAGEQVEIKGIVRSRKETTWGIPRGREFKLVVRNARNEEIMSSEQKLSPFGSFALSLPLKPTSPLGYYSIELAVKEPSKPKEPWTSIGHDQFRVEAFRPAEFEVTARSDQKSYIVGDTFAGSLTARYLFGAPLKNEPVTWRTSVTATSWRPEGFDGYFFGPMHWLTRYTGRSSYRLLTSKQEWLDDQGGIRVTSGIKVGEVSGSMSLLFEGDVTSPTRQQISGHTSVIVHGGEFYIGIASSTTFIKSDSTLTYKLITVNPDGSVVTDIPLRVKIYQRIWRSVRKAESGGRYAWQSEIENIPVDSAEVQSGKDPVLRSFKSGQAGFYFIEVEAKDKRGNELLSHSYFYVSGSSYVAWERTNDDKIELVADKAMYKPGDRANILVKSPYEEAIALVSVEREGIISHYTTKLVGSAPQIDLPIAKEHLPNVFVSVVLLQGRRGEPGKSKEADVGRPSFKVGYIKLSVSPLEKLLRLQVQTDKKDYRPADSVEVVVQVQDSTGHGRPAEVTISVADLGVLNLTGYRLPNPFHGFYSERPLAVKTTETRMHLVEQREYGEKGEDEGGGGAEAKALASVDAEGVRKDFRATAYWHPALLTDKRGKVRVKFKLPDNLTSFAVMAVAHTVESEFGYGENTLTVSKPLLLQPSLPRFARVGDSFEGGVVMVNYSEKEKNVRLEMTATGLKGSTKDTSHHVVKPGQALEVRGKYVAEKVGKAIFTFRARTDDDYDGLQWTIPINVPRVRESVVLYESTTDSLVREKIVIPKDIFKDLGEVELTAASTAMLGLSGGMSYLFSYPYGCLEQRLSAVLPIILAKDLVEAFRFEVYKDKDYHQVVGKILDEVPSFQRWNGGFSYWKNTQETWPYISAYAVYTLVQAKRAGQEVNDGVLKNGVEYLKRVMNGTEVCRYYTHTASNCTKALILYTLSLNGTPEHGYMEQLYNERRTLPLFARAYLLRALSAAKGNQSMIENLARDLTNQAKVAPTSAHFEERDDRGLDWVFSSNTRTTALVMQALVETQPENNLIPKVVRWVLEKRESGHWRTTQENLYVVDALATYFKKYEREEPRFRVKVRLAGKSLMDELFDGRSFKTASARESIGALSAGKEYIVVWSKVGPGRLYYGVRMNYYPAGESKVREEGFTLLKLIEQVGDAAKKKGTFTVSGLVRVTLTIVTNQERHFVVVNDPLPAGFETINSSFLTTASNIEQYNQSGEQLDWWIYNPFNHKEMYDDRVQLFADYLPAGVHTFTYMARVTSYGKFQMPSTRVEGMYEPEVFGQTSSRVIIVE